MIQDSSFVSTTKFTMLSCRGKKSNIRLYREGWRPRGMMFPFLFLSHQSDLVILQPLQRPTCYSSPGPTKNKKWVWCTPGLISPTHRNLCYWPCWDFALSSSLVTTTVISFLSLVWDYEPELQSPLSSLFCSVFSHSLILCWCPRCTRFPIRHFSP